MKYACVCLKLAQLFLPSSGLGSSRCCPAQQALCLTPADSCGPSRLSRGPRVQTGLEKTASRGRGAGTCSSGSMWSKWVWCQEGEGFVQAMRLLPLDHQTCSGRKASAGIVGLIPERPPGVLQYRGQKQPGDPCWM